MGRPGQHQEAALRQELGHLLGPAVRADGISRTPHDERWRPQAREVLLDAVFQRIAERTLPKKCTRSQVVAQLDG